MAGIRNPRDLESQRVGSGSALFFLESEIRLTTKTCSEIKILIIFGIRDQHFELEYGINCEKIYLVRYDPASEEK